MSTPVALERDPTIADHSGAVRFPDLPVYRGYWVTEFPALLDQVPGVAEVVTRYVQNQVQAENLHPNGNATKFYDVLDELWLSDPEALGALCSPDTAASIRELEAELLDVDRTRACIATMVESIP